MGWVPIRSLFLMKGPYFFHFGFLNKKKKISCVFLIGQGQNKKISLKTKQQKKSLKTKQKLKYKKKKIINT